MEASTVRNAAGKADIFLSKDVHSLMSSTVLTHETKDTHGGLSHLLEIRDLMHRPRRRLGV